MKTKIKILLRKQFSLTALTFALPWLFVACATHQPVISGAVGPGSSGRHSGEGQGYLLVYSDTQASPVHLDKGLSYGVHTSYSVQTQDGRRVKWVANHLGDTDEAPQLVSLPVGSYQVLAESTDYGRVTVPVVIEPFQTTKVHLQGKGSWKPVMTPTATELVRLPDGEPIGWASLAGK